MDEPDILGLRSRFVDAAFYYPYHTPSFQSATDFPSEILKEQL